MPWVAPIIGYSDNVGVLRCSPCASEDKRQQPVYGDSWFGSDDVCEACQRRFEHVPSRDYVQVAWGFPTPDIVFKEAPPMIDLTKIHQQAVTVANAACGISWRSAYNKEFSRLLKIAVDS
jgi:hypothetical protein